MNQFFFKTFGKNTNEEIYIQLSSSIENCLMKNGWKIIGRIGQGANNTAFEVSNIHNDNQHAAILLPTNPKCRKNSIHSELDEVRHLQKKYPAILTYVIKIYDPIICASIPITTDSRFCEGSKYKINYIDLIQKVDSSFNEKIEEIRERSIEERYNFVVNVNNTLLDAADFFMSVKYVFTDIHPQNLAFISDRVVFIDLSSFTNLSKIIFFEGDWDEYEKTHVIDHSKEYFRTDYQQDAIETIIYSLLGTFPNGKSRSTNDLNQSLARDKKEAKQLYEMFEENKI
jgi:predicted Holliday junction resolvase-like endonuclease